MQSSLLSRFVLHWTLLIAAACLPVAAHAQTSQNYTWRNVKVGGGGFVTGLVYSKAASGLAFARTDVGGVYRRTGHDTEWKPMTDYLTGGDSHLMGVLSIATDNWNPNRVYAACGMYLASWAPNGAVLYSTNKGDTWTKAQLPIKLGGNSENRDTGERLAIDPHGGTILYLGTNQDGLWKSTDYAHTWAKVTSFPASSTTFVFFDPRTGTGSNTITKTIYVGVASSTGNNLYRSTDAGATWSPVPGHPQGFLPQRIGMNSAGVIYITYDGDGPGALWKLTTSTGVWSKVTTLPSGQGGYSGLAVDATPGSNTVLVGTMDRWWPHDEVFRSTNGGTTWTALVGDANATFNYAQAPYASTMTPHWISCIAIDPFNSARAMFNTGYGLFDTANSGANWRLAVNGLEETVPLDLVSPPSGAPLVSAIGDFDGFRHDNLDVPPARRHESKGTNRSLDFAQNVPAIMVRTHAQSPYGSRSTDGGSTWQGFGSHPAAVVDNIGRIAISANATRIVWSPEGAKPYFSTNNGATWQACGWPVSTPANAALTPVADRVDSTKFYLYDSTVGTVFRSTDGGSSFAQAATGLQRSGGRLQAVPGLMGNVWLPTSGGLYRSTNAGLNFTAVGGGVTSARSVGFGKAAPGQTHPAVYIIGTVNGVIGFFRSDNVGASWVRINNSAQQFGWGSFIIGDPRTYGRAYLGTGGRGILYGQPQ